MLADQDKRTSIDGLNQMFRISKTANNRTGIQKDEKRISALDIDRDSVLSRVDVGSIVKSIESGKHRILKDYKFQDTIELFAKAYADDRYFDFDLNFKQCKKCEFRTGKESENKKSGVKECFSKKMNWDDSDFNDPTVFEISKLHHTKLDMFNELNVLKLEDITDEQLQSKSESKQVLNGWTLYERQCIQKQKSLDKDYGPEILTKELKKEIDSWDFPLNFIDFEASVVPLPFFKGQAPYEKVVFQFSHHIVYKDGSGRIEHANEYINVEAGAFPNFEFVRALKKALSSNEGTVFQYSNYENTTLNQIKKQLEESNEPDKEELCDFIKTLTLPPKDKDYAGELWKPKRGMVDLLEVIKAYYYNPHTKGSNSIKDVLPAIFKSSEFIRDKYSQPISKINLTSQNFDSDKVWLQEVDGELDPYKTLDKVFEHWDDSFAKDNLEESIKDGGAAMTAYGLTQYTNLSNTDRNKIKKGLLKYCELDTLAMVMVYEHLKELTE